MGTRTVFENVLIKKRVSQLVHTFIYGIFCFQHKDFFPFKEIIFIKNSDSTGLNVWNAGINY
jgi:hypothetical protein